MKKLRKISKEYYLRQIVCCWMVFCMLLFVPAQVAMALETGALPDGFVLVAGSSSDPSIGSEDTMLIQNISNGAIFRWDGGFNIGEDATVEFQFIADGSSVLNRDITGNMSELLGTMTANGNVWVINPAGILIGPNAYIDVTQLVASSLDIADADFLDGLPYTFTGGATAGDVTNNSEYIYADRIALIGGNVYNNNIIEASEHIIMAAGDTVRITDGSPIVVEVDMADFEHVVQNDSDLYANHITLAAGDVFSTAYIYASDYYSDSETHTDAFASVTIDAARDVRIDSTNSDAEYSIEAFAGYDEGEGQALAKIDITAGRNVLIEGTAGSDEEGGLYANAYASDATGDGQGGRADPTAEINVTAESGDLTVIDGGYVWAEGYYSSGDYDDRLGNGTGIINFTAGGSVVVQNGSVIQAHASSSVNTDGDVAATLVVDAGGSVIVQNDSAMEVIAYSEDGNATAILDIDADGDVSVDSDSYIDAYSGGSMYEVVANQLNSALVDIEAGGNVIVNGLVEARAEVYDDYVDSHGAPVPTATNAEVIVKAFGDVIINETLGASDGLITAQAFEADDNTASVTVLAVENVIVNDGAAAFEAEVVAWAEEDTSNSNEAFIGIATQNGNITLNGQLESTSRSDTAYDFSNVEVAANGAAVINGSIVATAFSLEGDAQISISAGGEISGNGNIEAEGLTTANISVYATSQDNITFEGYASVTSYGGEYGGEPDVIIGPIEPSEGGPDWSWSEPPEVPVPEPQPEPEATDDATPTAPLYQIQTVPTIEGCPQLVQAAAMELGITAETIQVGIGNALALNPSLQPCEACATLVDAAGILRDEGDLRMAAMVQTFNALAPADAPFTPETAALIATAFGDAAEGTQYASAMEYIDAFVQYVTVLNAGLGSPVGDSVAFVMDKYGAGVMDSDNGNIAAFVATRLEAISK